MFYGSVTDCVWRSLKKCLRGPGSSISRLRYANQKTLAGLILKFFLLCLREERDFEE
nr:MAG TPA: hypothetical protein [Caudoviricetes sp.]DAU83230.1 MAG TPA: hypothetical protein [Caudoviricetes sp.]